MNKQVQKLIAESPQLLNEESAYLGKPLKGAPAKKLPLEYIVKATPNVTKHKDVQEKPNHKMEGSAENAVGKASLSSVQNASQSSTYRPISRMPPQPTVTADSKMGSWSYNQPPGNQPSGHQWLIPVMSPSEGLVYKPYPGPGFMGPVCGGTPGSTPMMGNFLNYGVPPSHPHYQGLGVAPFAPPAGHGYFPPYGMPVMNPAMNPALSGSTGEQMNPFAGQGLHGQLSGGGANFSMQNQSSCNVPSQKNAAVSNIGKSRASKDREVHVSASKESEVHASTASSPSERAQGTGVGHTAVEGKNALALFPTFPPVRVPDGGSQPRDMEQRPSRVIKVVPHNARSATESVARIFRSIQEERNQYESG
ncbi:hypothetical protein RJ640_006332 [Escallonia rubra]|uniref:Early flowering 3 n=1 Tax=Escallonia rubra TaxID=112253 RepID=A0AA88UI01_9ASTE|nr:hypothetical protein RJ640_006332 [Escallonia rubra]